MNIFNHKFLYTDNTAFFLKDKISVFETVNILCKFSLVSGLSPNTTKCKIAGIGTLKGVNVAVCGLKYLNLTKKSVKILGVRFSYNKKLEHEMSFQGHIKIESILRLWRMRNLTIEGKVLVFQSFAISRIVHLSLITTILHTIIQLNNMQRKFIWNGKNPKIKHLTLSNSFSFKDSGLKDIDVLTKVISLHCSWIKRLYDENFHEW